MKVWVYFEDSCEPFDIPSDLSVRAMKRMVKENFLVPLCDDKHLRQYLELSHGGAALADSWALCDVGIASGSAVRCLIKTEQRPVIHVFNAVTGDTLAITGSEALLHTSVAQLKSMVSTQSSLPVSAFRLSTLNDVPLYNCNRLQDYAITMGTTVHLDTWDGWVDFLRGCLLGHRLTVQTHLSEERLVMRFQLRVALYIAATLGHLDMAGWLLERGAHAGEPVGVHPYRQWCHKTAHRDAAKCPIHAAVENSQLLILKLFVTRNILSLVCQNPDGRNPLRIAIQHGHRDCVRYLANKLCSVVSLPKMSLPMHIYLQMKHWVRLGQRRAAINQSQFTTVAPFKARVGDILLVDGFNQPQMSYKSMKAMTTLKRDQSRPVQTKTVQLLPPIRNLCSVSLSKKAQPQLPSMQSVNPGDLKMTQNRWKSDEKRGGFPLLSVNRERMQKKVFAEPPPTFSNILTASLEKLSQQCDRTPRENAMYYLGIASTFKEKPWSKQLSIARTLARRHFHPMA
nr:protein ANKUB1-like [Solea senegalensis]